MPYQNNIPQPTDVKSQSQADILGNFQALSPWGNGYGEFINQAGAPVIGAGNDGIYTFNNATTTKNELYAHIQRPGILTAEIPFTASKMSNTATAGGGCDNGWSYLPSGLLIKWGATAANIATVPITTTATAGGPNFTRVFRVFVSPTDLGVGTNFNCGQRTIPDNISGNFTAYCANPNPLSQIRWLVIGV